MNLRRFRRLAGVAVLFAALAVLLTVPVGFAAVPTLEQQILQMFPPRNVSIPAITPWGFPAYTGDPALEPLPNSFDIVERPAWFDGIPVTIRPFPRPSIGDGGPDDNHADMYVFFYADGTPVNQPPLLETAPKNAAGPGVAIPDIAARLFSANWEIHVVRVPQDYVTGSIKGLADLDNPRWVLEDIQTNVFVTFPIIPVQSTIPDLGLNNLQVSSGIFQNIPVRFVEYDVIETEAIEKPLYLFRKPSGEFAGGAVLSTIPGMPHSTSFWEVFIVLVPENYVADTLKSEDAVLASGYPIINADDVFAPVETVDGKRTVFPDFMSVLAGPDGKFSKARFPLAVASPVQPYHNDPRINPRTIGFTMKFSFNEVSTPRVPQLVLPLVNTVDELLLQAFGAKLAAGGIQLPSQIARQLLVQQNGKLTHLSQAAVDTMPLSEIVPRGQALFEREIFEEDGAGPAFNAYSCGTCHGLPFNLGVEPTSGGAGVRFRNALQPTDGGGPKVSRNTPHIFGAGIREQLARELSAADPAVVQAFGWKGGTTLRGFSAGPFKGELGLESVEKVAEMAGVSLAQAATLDLDHDGSVAEMSVGDITAVAVFQASLPRPIQVNKNDPAVILGRQKFDQIGCAGCHTPVQTLQSSVVTIANPETGGVASVPLPGVVPGQSETFKVELYSDLKRHSMGPLLADPAPQGGVAADVFLTQELWGLADSAPYHHDGLSLTIEDAILRHGGDAQSARDAFNSLAAADKQAVLTFLGSLRLPSRAQLELEAFNRLTSAAKGILSQVIESFRVAASAHPVLVAWIANPPLDGTGRVSGNLTVQVSITAQEALSSASLVVDGKDTLPLVFNPATGFHEAQVNTANLSEGSHQLAVQVLDAAGNSSATGAVRSTILVDNMPDATSMAAIPPCDPPQATVKCLNISAIDVDITINRHGDHNLSGKMYVLDEAVNLVRAREAAPLPDRVNIGLRDDPIQPLVIRANVGDSVVVNFTNRMSLGTASMEIQGLPVDVRVFGGSNVGKNPNTLVDPGQTMTYVWTIGNMDHMEGSYVIRSMGDPRDQQSMGLFGVLNVEPKGSTYLSPITGQPIRSGWEAMIVDPNGKDFREDTIIYHEFGDEEFDLTGVDGSPIPQIDPELGTYRPGSRLLNYRSEPFMRREQLAGASPTGQKDESQDYGSYMFGDPPTTMPRGYVGDPTKRRIVHAGSERFHVEHLHGGSIRWPFDPDVEPDFWGLPLDKHPAKTQSLSQRLDSQSIGPGETYTVQTEGAAGGLQGGAGEFLYHCHYPEHYIGGMWSFWRVFDTLQTANNGLFGNPALAELPDRAGKTPAAVDSNGLLGKKLPSGKTLTTGATTATTKNIDEWVRSVLPEQGVPVGFDASVWDWVKDPVTGVFMAEKETTVSWANYRSSSPDQRPKIMFNPNNGRPAFPLLRPHLGRRPPFAPGRSGSPYLGQPDADHPDSLIPADARRIQYTIVAAPMPISFNDKFAISSPFGALNVLDEDKEDILAGRKPKEQLTIRANVGDGVDVTFYNEVPDNVPNSLPFSKHNVHIHFVQFDTQASDGVISGMSYEQSVRPYFTEGPPDGAGGQPDGIKLTSPAAAGTNTLTVDAASTLQVNAFVGVGFGVATNKPDGFEFAQIVSKNGNTLTLDRPLAKSHPAGQFVGVEFVRYQWYADVEEGTTFFHSHVGGIEGFGKALTGTLIVEPRGSQWLDPKTGLPVRSGTQVDIVTDQPIAPGVPVQNMREFVLHQMGAITDLDGDDNGGGSKGQPGGFNMRQEPIMKRLTVNPDPSLVFSSVIHGDPATPLLRAYAGDLVGIRIINTSGHDNGSFHIAGQRFRLERFDPKEAPKDSISLGISERFDLGFVAGGVGLSPVAPLQGGDYVYMSGTHEKMMDGAWGILRVFDTLQPDLRPLRQPAPPAGAGFPQNTECTQQDRRNCARPPRASDTGSIVPADMPVRVFDVVAIQRAIQFSNTLSIANGRAYVLAEDEAAVLAGTKPLEPLVLRANVGEAVRINFTNHLPATGNGLPRASLHISQLTKTTASLGSAFGFNNDSTAAPGETITQWYVIDARNEVPRSFNITDFGDPISGPASGLYGAFIVAPAGSTYHDVKTGLPVRSGAVVDVRNPGLPGGGYRDAALIFHDDDQVMNRDVMPYRIDVEGVRGINYKAEPFSAKNPDRLVVDANIANVFHTGDGGAGSHADPLTPLIEAKVGDPVLLHVLQGYGQHAHVFAAHGYNFPFDASRAGMSHFPARQFAPHVSIDAYLVDGAGGQGTKLPGDYMYRDMRNPFLEAGLWGIVRVATEDEARVLPLPDLRPGWNLVSRHVIPDNTSVGQFLASIQGKYDRVSAVDPADPTRFLVFTPGGAGNTLASLDNTMGFWIRMTQPAFLSPQGRLPATTDIPLKKGWNLVGWPSFSTKPVGTALSSIAGKFDQVLAYDASDAADPWKRFDPAAPAFGSDLRAMRPLLGYWIHMTEAATLRVENP